MKPKCEEALFVLALAKPAAERSAWLDRECGADNALRARLSPSERDSLKKEQLAWINRRNLAAQVAKKNAHENPTDGADREVTKMTLARVTELEKRLKKGK